MKPIEEEKFVAKGRFVLSEDYKDSFGNSQKIARIHEQTCASRERRLAALLKNAPQMFHLLLEIERKYFPLGKACDIFDEIDSIVEEIKKAGEPRFDD